MREFYLSLPELAFRLEGECVFQVQLARRRDAAPITRGYIAERGTELRKLDARDLADETAMAAGE